jgi:hypothetical protein
MNTEIVKAGESKTESLWFFVAIGCIVLVCAGLIAANRRVEVKREMSAFQISAFEDLNSAEQGTYNDLLTAALDIGFIRDADSEKAWPMVNRLAYEFIPPFVRNAAWESRGRLEWRQLLSEEVGEGESVCLYLGETAQPEISGSFLLIMDSREDEDAARIWHKAGGNAEPPGTLDEESLARTGWLEVVPYLGKEELERLKG